MGAPFWSSPSRKQAACCRRESEDAEVVAGDEGAHDRFGHGLRPRAANRDRPPCVAGFHSRKLFKLRQALLEHVIGVGGEERVVPVVVPAAVNAAIVFVADADEGLGIGHRQIMQQDGVDQREDRRVCADAERQCEQNGDGKARRFAKLAQRVGYILKQNPHRSTSTHFGLHS